MESTTENPPWPDISDVADSPTNTNVDIFDHNDLLSRLQSLQQSFDTIQSKSSLMEENLLLLQQERDDALNNNSRLNLVIQEVSNERDSLRDQVKQLMASFQEKEDGFVKRIDEAYLTMEKLDKEVEFVRERNDKLELEIKETREKNGLLLKIIVDSVKPVKDSLVKVKECLDDENVVERVDDEEEKEELELDDELRAVWEECKAITRLASEAESKANELKEMKKKEIRELENSVVSLTEENRDINSLLRVALVEKEAVERSLNKLKGNNEQKRVPLLQRVGFGFIMGSGSTEQSMESSGAASNTTNASASASTKSDGSECEEEVVSLTSTVERIMKKLRLENSQLRRSLEESRSDTERLQNLTQKQAQEIAENILYIKELEDRERVLTQNVEELQAEIKETEAEVARWREACELEVQAAKKAIDESEKLVVILKQELEKTKSNLEISNGKLKLKDELAAAAMAAQAAAERSLQLADSRAAVLRQRIEELTRQVEEAESKEQKRHKVRHICWPWRAIKASTGNNASNRVQNVRRMLPEMQALLHYNV